MSLFGHFQNTIKNAAGVAKGKKKGGKTQGGSKTQPKQFDETILIGGGESIFTTQVKTVRLVNGVEKESVSTKSFNISVHSHDMTYLPKYKYHFKNGMGNRVFIKTSSMLTAQMVCDALTGEKGKYRVSGSAV